MNYVMVLYILGYVLKFESGFLLLPAVVGLIYQEPTALSYLFIAAICFLCGILLTRKKPKSKSLYAREGFVTVALSWVVMSVFGAIPFVLSNDIPFYVDALFETISGFTTTGASILTDVEALSHAGLFWRSFSHWIGGMGVFVFIMAILPMMGGSNMNLMRAESTGPSVGKLVPHVKDTAKILYGIYITLTLLCIILLCIFGMPLFDSLTTAFGTIGTGGFSIKSDSLTGYSPALQNITTIFMILAGVNYTVYFLLLCGKIKDALKLDEVRWYFLAIFSAAGIITLNIRHLYPTLEESIRHAFFQVGSIITTTGFSTTNYDLWPEMSKCILIILTLTGACAGSTGGGIKFARLVILFKAIRKELSLSIHPREVRKVRMNGHAVSHDVIRSTNVFITIYFTLFLISILLISVDEFDFTTNFTAVAAMINNVGPGFAMVGPVENFSIFSVFSKFVLMFDMVAGRLELYPMMVLFLPDTWKRR